MAVELWFHYGRWVRSGRLFVLVDESCDSRAASYGGKVGRRARLWRWVGRSLFQRPVWTVPVVVINIVGQESVQLPGSEDQGAVEQLSACGAHPALRERVGRRSQLHRMRTIGTDVCG